MRKIINSLALLLAITVLLSMPAHAAEGSEIMPCESDVLSRYTSYLVVSSGNEIWVNFRVVATQTLDKIGALRIEIQRSSDGESWTTVTTYKYADYSSMMGTDTSVYSSYVTYYGEYGYYYRAKISFYGQKGFNLYSASSYSDVVYLGS